MLWTFGVMLWVCRSSDATVTDLSLNQGMVFIQQSRMIVTAQHWIIAIDVDFDIYSKDVEALKILVQTTRSVQRGEAGKTLDSRGGTVSMELELLYDRLTELGEQIEQVQSAVYQDKSGSKRGLANFGGTDLRFLTGTPDNNDWVGLNERLALQDKRLKKTVQLVREHATLFNASFEVIQSNQGKIDQLTKLFNQSNGTTMALANAVGNEEATLLTLKATMKMSSDIQYASALVSAMEHRVASLGLAFELAARGQLSSYLLRPRDFFDILLAAKNTLAELQLPVVLTKGSIYRYYRLAGVHLATTQGRYRIFVEIPLTSATREFTLYRSLPLPRRDAEAGVFIFITPQCPFFAISTDMTRYMELADLDACRGGEELRICAPTIPIRIGPSKSCVYNVFTGHQASEEGTCVKRMVKTFAPVFYKISRENKWVYSVDKVERLFKTCNGRTTVHFIEGTGFLEMEANCDLILEGIHLVSHGNLVTDRQGTYDGFIIPEPANLTSEIRLEVLRGAKPEHKEQITDVIQGLGKHDMPSVGLTEQELRDEVRQETELQNLNQRYQDLKLRIETGERNLSGVRVVTTTGTVLGVIILGGMIVFIGWAKRAA